MIYHGLGFDFPTCGAGQDAQPAARGYQYAAPMGLRNEFLIRHDIYVVFRRPTQFVGFNPNVFSFG
jgi:hypothetical protein